MMWTKWGIWSITLHSPAHSSEKGLFSWSWEVYSSCGKGWWCWTRPFIRGISLQWSIKDGWSWQITLPYLRVSWKVIAGNKVKKFFFRSFQLLSMTLNGRLFTFHLRSMESPQRFVKRRVFTLIEQGSQLGKRDIDKSQAWANTALNLPGGE